MIINAFDDFENEVIFNCAVAALYFYNYARIHRSDIAEDSGILNSLEDIIIKKKLPLILWCVTGFFFFHLLLLSPS